jgi:hypothetical protein
MTLHCASCDGELGMLRVASRHLWLAHLREPHPIHPPRLAAPSDAHRSVVPAANGGHRGAPRTTSAGSRTRRPDFWTAVDQSGGSDACWPWQRHRNPEGYGVTKLAGFRRAHRLAWCLTNGPIPDGMLVCHTCDNPPCCNPAHLFLGTESDNRQDMLAKGRGPQPWTTCRRGHELTDDNRRRRPGRGCRICHRLQSRRAIPSAPQPSRPSEEPRVEHRGNPLAPSARAVPLSVSGERSGRSRGTA